MRDKKCKWQQKKQVELVPLRVQPAHTPSNGNAKSGGDGVDITGPLARFPHILGPAYIYAPYPRTDAAVLDGWCWRAEAKGGADAGDIRLLAALSTQSSAEQGVRLDLVAAAVLSVLASLALALHAAACSHCSATACWESSGLDHSHAATPQRVRRVSCAQLLRSVLGAACR